MATRTDEKAVALARECFLHTGSLSCYEAGERARECASSCGLPDKLVDHDGTTAAAFTLVGMVSCGMSDDDILLLFLYCFVV